MRENTAKDFALAKTAEIIQLCNDLYYIKNEELRIKGLMQIEKLANGIEGHLEYLDIKSELLEKAIADGEIANNEIKLRYGAGYYTLYKDRGQIINDTNGTGLNIFNCLNDEFELIEDNTIDIDSIKETTTGDIANIDGMASERIKNKFNELVQAVKQLNKEIKELKENNK